MIDDPDAGPPLSSERAEDVKTVTKGGAVQIAGQISQRSVLFLFSSLAFRILGKSLYGRYREVTQILAIAAQIGLAGFNYAAMRFIALARARGRPEGVRGAARVGLTGAAVASAAVFFALLLFAEDIAAPFAEEPADAGRLATLLRVGAPYVPLFALMQVLRYCTQAYRTMVPSVIAGNIVQPIARFVLGVAALLTGFAVAGAVATLVVATAVGAVAAAWFFRRILSVEERRAVPAAPTKEMVRFALPQGGSSLLGVQSLGLGIILLGVLSTDASTGLFGAALSLQGPGTVFLGGIVNIWAPVVSDLHDRGEIDRLGSLYQTITRWVATFSFPVFAALMLEPDLFVRLFAGEKGAGAEPVVAILAAGNLFYTGTGPTGYVLSMTGRPAVNFLNSVAGVALYVALGLLIVPGSGVVGMAIVDAVVTAMINVARVIEARVLVGVQPFGRSFLKPVVATAAGAVALFAWRYLPSEGTAMEITGIVVAAAVYLWVLRALGLDPEERLVWERIRTRAFRRKERRS